jgi:Uma2 family endonuclease
MTISLLEDVPLAPHRELGPFREADYMQLPDETRCELIYGRFYMSPSPRVVHQVVVGALWRLLSSVATKTGGIAMMAPLDVHLADHSVVQPDVIFVANDRLDRVRDWIYGAPTLLVEVLSPGTARRDRSEKLRLYAESGVDEYWVVDAAERQIEFLRWRDGSFVVALPEGRLYRSGVVGLEVDLESFWGEVTATVGRLGEPAP